MARRIAGLWPIKCYILRITTDCLNAWATFPPRRSKATRWTGGLRTSRRSCKPWFQGHVHELHRTTAHGVSLAGAAAMEPGFMNSAVPPMLVTGSHNSGTTWVGRMLAASRSVAYSHEPFNVGHRRPGICTDTFHRWFTYVCVDNESHYRGDIERLVMLSY